MTLGLSPALGSAPASAPAGPNPNLLLWSEALDNTAWVKTNIGIGADADGAADEVTNTAAFGSVRQTTTTAAAAGAQATNEVTPGASYVRYSVTGTFDGSPYTYSAELKDAGGGETARLVLKRAGGFLRPGIESDFADGDFLARYHQLEAGSSFTTYQRRDGT